MLDATKQYGGQEQGLFFLHCSKFLGSKVSKIQWSHVMVFNIDLISNISRCFRRIAGIFRRPSFPQFSFFWNPEFWISPKYVFENVLGFLGIFKVSWRFGSLGLLSTIFCPSLVPSSTPLQFQCINKRINTKSGGRRRWDWGLPALHRHHSGTGRKVTRTCKRCGNEHWP